MHPSFVAPGSMVYMPQVVNNNNNNNNNNFGAPTVVVLNRRKRCTGRRLAVCLVVTLSCIGLALLTMGLLSVYLPELCYSNYYGSSTFNDFVYVPAVDGATGAGKTVLEC